MPILIEVFYIANDKYVIIRWKIHRAACWESTLYDNVDDRAALGKRNEFMNYCVSSTTNNTCVCVCGNIQSKSMLNRAPMCAHDT